MASLSALVDCQKLDAETTTLKRYTAMQASNVKTFEIAFDTGAHTRTHTHIGIVNSKPHPEFWLCCLTDGSCVR